MKVTRWAKLYDWSPTSSQQVLKYLKHKKYPIPINRKTKKPTTGEEALEKILRKHPTDLVIPKILTARRLQKADAYLSDTYVGLDGRFHPEFTRHPETLRFSSRRPNIQNQPKGKKDAEALIAEAILSSIIADAGNVLIERDYKAEEALLLGYYAQDDLYMRAARLGIYSWLLGPKLGKPVDLNRPDKEVLADLNAIKYGHPFLYSVYKTCTLGVGYGMGVKSLATRLEPYYVDEAKEIALAEAQKKRWWKDINPAKPFDDARVVELTFNLTSELAKAAALDFQKSFESAAPKVVEFQSRIRDQAHRERKLTNAFGYTRHFYDVFTKRDGKWVLGSEAEKVLAFLPQSTGAGIMSECLISVDEIFGSDPDFNPCITEHDKIVCEVSEANWQNYQAALKQIMDGPIHALGNLEIETEGKWGYSWAEMESCV